VQRTGVRRLHYGDRAPSGGVTAVSPDFPAAQSTTACWRYCWIASKAWLHFSNLTSSCTADIDLETNDFISKNSWILIFTQALRTIRRSAPLTGSAVAIGLFLQG
jgi:hypothetical protein